MGDLPNATTWGYWTPMVLVLPNGKRFIQEGQSHDAAQACLDCGYREWWVIFDQRAFDNRCVGTSVKNNVNIHEDVYRTADTIEDLAVAMDVPVDNLVATFAEYDGYVEAGEDAAFGKTSGSTPSSPVPRPQAQRHALQDLWRRDLQRRQPRHRQRRQRHPRPVRLRRHRAPRPGFGHGLRRHWLLHRRDPGCPLRHPHCRLRLAHRQ